MSPQCKDKDEPPSQNQKHMEGDGDLSPRMNLGKAFAKLTAIDSDQQQQRDICQVCATKESQCQLIKQCSGCNVSTYCSRSCQRVDWVTHKPLCQALSKVTDSDTIFLDSYDLLNFNACLEYALANIPNVKHVHLLISEEHKVRDEVCDYYEIQESDVVVKLSPETLSSFLKAYRDSLTSFRWDAFGVCECARCVRRITNRGKLFLNLVDLEILRLDTVQFDNITTLSTVIHQSHKTLSRLTLDYMAVGVDTCSEDRWTRSDAASLAKAISSCKNLVNLSLAGNSLNPSDMKLMLVNGLPNLRVLDLSSTNEHGGYLNDKACAMVSK